MVFSAQERLLQDLAGELEALDAQGLRRHLAAVEAVDGARIRIQGTPFVNWSSNDYLGLSTHPALAAAAVAACRAYGIGARASRLLTGTTSWHCSLEERLAAWFGAEAALVYPSGYHANLGTLGALLSSQDTVVVDRLSHASLFDAARASRATLRVFQHNDSSHAATLLARGSAARRRLIVTEGLFSMQGDRAPLRDLLEVAQAHDAVVYVDDAHGAFALGATGRGAPEAAGVPHDRLLYMGTLGKALGCQGGFVVGPRSLVDFLQNRARTFIYTTALAVPVAAAACAALDVLAREPQRRARLRERAAHLRGRLARVQGVPSEAQDQLLPIVVGDASQALALAARLREQGMWAPAIRPPTVPEGTARIRVSLTAHHTDADLEALVGALEDACAFP